MPTRRSAVQRRLPRRKRYVVDTSVLVSAVNSADAFHLPCYQWIRERFDENAIFVVPALAFFEFQATQSRIARLRKRPAYRELRLHAGNARLYPMTRRFLQRCHSENLYDRFSALRGADLVFACIAALEKLPLVTRDTGFNEHGSEIEIINPETVWDMWHGNS